MSLVRISASGPMSSSPTAEVGTFVWIKVRPGPDEKPLTCASLGRHAMLADIREVMEAALEKAVVPAGDVKNRHVDFVRLVADVELTPVSVVLGMVEVILEVGNRIL